VLLSSVVRRWRRRSVVVKRLHASETGSRSRPIGHHAYFEVVENGSAGLGKSLLLFAGSKRYMFNCSEGLARALQAEGVERNLEGFDNVFFTSALMCELAAKRESRDVTEPDDWLISTLVQ